MSTTIPESVSTTTSTTTTTTNATPSTSHTANPAAALDPLTTSTSTTTADLQQSAMHAASVVGSALKTAATHVQAAAVSTGAAISSAAHNVDAKYHVSDKVSDAASHVSAAIKHGNPVHAAKHASTAATIGDAERAKHEAGPLPAEAHAAGSSSAPSSSSTIASDSSFGHSQTTTEKVSNSASDVASHVQASLAQGNPVHAAKYAGTAAMIGQAEREKHAHGPLEDEASIKAADAASAAPAAKP